MTRWRQTSDLTKPPAPWPLSKPWWDLRELSQLCPLIYGTWQHSPLPSSHSATAPGNKVESNLLIKHNNTVKKIKLSCSHNLWHCCSCHWHSHCRLGCLGWAGTCRDLCGCRSQHLPELFLQFPARFPWLPPRGYAITCLLIPTGKLEPLVALLMGATTATLVGEGADWRFLGGNAGGGLQDTTGIDASITLPLKKKFKKNSEASQVVFQKAFVSQELFCKTYPSKTLI